MFNEKNLSKIFAYTTLFFTLFLIFSVDVESFLNESQVNYWNLTTDSKDYRGSDDLTNTGVTFGVTGGDFERGETDY